MSEASSDEEYIVADHVHKCLKLVPVYKNGAFSCSSLEDVDEDDEDVKRILAERGEPKDDRETEVQGFSSIYRVAVMETSVSNNCNLSSLLSLDQTGEYLDWDQALDNVVLVYPPLGVCSRARSEATETCRLPNALVTSRGITPAEADVGSVKCPKIMGAWDLKKCLEGALYGRDSKDFVVAQPHSIANKNLDFGQPRMSHKAAHESKYKVENWMSKYVGTENG